MIAKIERKKKSLTTRIVKPKIRILHGELYPPDRPGGKTRKPGKKEDNWTPDHHIESPAIQYNALQPYRSIIPPERLKSNPRPFSGGMKQWKKKKRLKGSTTQHKQSQPQE